MSVWPDTHGAGDAANRVGLVHTIQAAHERGLAATGGADQSRGVVRRNFQADALKGVVGAIPGIQIRYFDGYTH